MENKMKLKKGAKLVILGIICLIIILVVILLLSKNKDTDNSNKQLTGEKLINGLYKYDTGKKDSLQVNIIDNNIYYLSNNERTYKLNEINVFTNKTKEIGTINDSICFLSDYFISCMKDEKIIVYDNNLKEIYNGDEKFMVVPYQDSLLVLKDRDLYFNNKKIRTIKDDFKDFESQGYYSTKDNTFMAFSSNNDIYVYNVKDDSYTKLDEEDFKFYENGVYYGHQDKIVVKDLVNNSSKEYNNLTNDEVLNISTVRDNLYFYMYNDHLKIYNLETNKYNILDYKFEQFIDKMVLSGNYLYLICREFNPKVYVVKLDEIDSNYYSDEEYKEVQKNRITKKVQELENKYNNVDIVYDINDIKEEWSKEFIEEDNYEVIEESLDSIDNVLNRFGNEFLSCFKHDKFNGLKLIITKKIVASKNANVQNIAGLTFTNDTYYIIAFSKSDLPTEKTLYHEMMHAIDYNAVNLKYDITGNWYDYNPKGFEYGVSHYNNGDSKYTTYGEDDVYFIDSYGQINQSEDRARIFENICYVDDENIIKKYPNLLKKAEYIRDELIKYYPFIKNTTIFDSIR